MTFNFLGPGLTVNVEAKVKEQIILDSSERKDSISNHWKRPRILKRWLSPAAIRESIRQFFCTASPVIYL